MHQDLENNKVHQKPIYIDTVVKNVVKPVHEKIKENLDKEHDVTCIEEEEWIKILEGEGPMRWERLGDGVNGIKCKEIADELNLEWPDADKWTRERETVRKDGIRNSSEGWNSQDMERRDVTQDRELGEFQDLTMRVNPLTRPF